MNTTLSNRLLGCGSFGSVHQICDTQGSSYAKKTSLDTLGLYALFHEHLLYQHLSKEGGHAHILSLHKTSILSSLLDRRIDLHLPLYQESLADKLRDHAFSLQEITHILRSLNSALAFLKSKQIIHKDVKLSNILLGKSNHIVLADFGSAEWQDPIYHQADCEEQTLEYRSPEALLTHGLPKPAFPRSYPMDMWSFGICMIRLYLQRYPFMLCTSEQDVSERTYLHLLYRHEQCLERKYPLSFIDAIGPHATEIYNNKKPCIIDIHPWYSDDSFDLPLTVCLERTAYKRRDKTLLIYEQFKNLMLHILQYAPWSRPTPEQVALHPFLQTNTINKSWEKHVMIGTSQEEYCIPPFSLEELDTFHTARHFPKYRLHPTKKHLLRFSENAETTETLLHEATLLRVLQDCIGILQQEASYFINSPQRFALVYEESYTWNAQEFLHSVMALSEVTRKQRMQSIFYDLLQALCSLQEHDIIHGNIQLQSLFFSPQSGHTKLGNFSIAFCSRQTYPIVRALRSMSSDELQSISIAPELKQNQIPIPFAIDIWGLGHTLQKFPPLVPQTLAVMTQDDPEKRPSAEYLLSLFASSKKQKTD